MTGCIVRLSFWTLWVTTMATIISLNTYADYKTQTLISIAIFIAAFYGGVCYFNTAFKQNSGFLTWVAIMLFVSLYAYGFGVIFLFQQCEWGTEFIRNIATYEIVSQDVLNVTSALLLTGIGFFSGGLGISPGREE